MHEAIYDDIALEQLIKMRFGLAMDIDKVIVRQIPVSRTAQATVFLSKKKQLYVVVAAQSKQTLGDVKKIVSRMGLTAELYVPPGGQPAPLCALRGGDRDPLRPARRPGGRRELPGAG